MATNSSEGVQALNGPVGARRAGLEHLGGKYLTFFLDDEEYAIEILKVHEIIGIMPITPVPKTPEFVLGLINLRGKVISVIDLRRKFDMARKDWTDETCIIVVQSAYTQIGVVVDKVSEVVQIAGGDVETTPDFGSEVNTDFLLGISNAEGRVRLLLDIDRVLTKGEASQLEMLAGSAAES